MVWPDNGILCSSWRYICGPWFNIKMPPYQYKKFHFGDRADVSSSYLHNGISYTGKWTSLYWINPLVVSLHTINPQLKLKFHKTSFACNHFLIPSNHWIKFSAVNSIHSIMICAKLWIDQDMWVVHWSLGVDKKFHPTLSNGYTRPCWDYS